MSGALSQAIGDRHIEPVLVSKEGWGELLHLLPPDMCAEVEAAYDDDRFRHFSDREQAGGLWATWLALGGDPGDRAMIYAIAYHAVVIDSEVRFENIRRSAIAFGQRAEAMGLDRSVASEAIDMILSRTAPMAVATLRPIQFCDVYLSRFAGQPDDFRAASERIRIQHAISEADWHRQRRSFLLQFKGRRIYRSGMAPPHWEVRAQSNIMVGLADIG